MLIETPEDAQEKLLVTEYLTKQGLTVKEVNEK